MTTNKLVRLEDVQTTLKQNYGDYYEVAEALDALPTYPEPIKGSNHSLLQEYIDRYNLNPLLRFDAGDIVGVLQAIQSHLTEGTEYKIGERYEFSGDGKAWIIGKFKGYAIPFGSYNHIRPIQLSAELTQAIEVMEKNGYTFSKK